MTGVRKGRPPDDPGQARHVILVVFDTLRRDAVGCYGSPPPWGAIRTPNLDAFARESVRFTRAYPESLPTLCARRAIYTGQRTYPFHNGDFRRFKGDFVGTAAGWGPIPEEQHTLAEIFTAEGFRTGLISDLYHQFKPSKNFWRGFDQWTFIRGQETDSARSGPMPTQADVDYWIPKQFQEMHGKLLDAMKSGYNHRWFSRTILRNMHDRVAEESWFNAQVMQESGRWVEQNLDAERMFLTIECFDPHEPWFVPEHYRRRYDPTDGQETVISPYAEVPHLPEQLVRRTRGNYAGLVEMVDRWFGHLIETLRTTGVLDDALVIVTSDHGHGLWERGGWIGKRGYPSDPETIDVPMIVRHPRGLGAGTVCDAFVQHHDIAATILDAAGVAPPEAIDGQSFYRTAFAGAPAARDHVTIGWGSAVTVIDDKWWFNAKVDGRGAFLHDDPRPAVGAANVADRHPAIAQRLFETAMADAKNGIPEYLMLWTKYFADATGCSPFAALGHPESPPGDVKQSIIT
jgi:arylsulfatase A-like enzyme